MKIKYQECADCMWMGVNQAKLPKCPDCGHYLITKDLEFPLVVYIQMYDDDGEPLAEPSYTAGEDSIYTTDQRYVHEAALPIQVIVDEDLPDHMVVSVVDGCVVVGKNLASGQRVILAEAHWDPKKAQEYEGG